MTTKCPSWYRDLVSIPGDPPLDPMPYLSFATYLSAPSRRGQTGAKLQGLTFGRTESA